MLAGVSVEFQFTRRWHRYSPPSPAGGFSCTGRMWQVSFFVEMQFDEHNVELPHHGFYAPLDGRMVGAVADDEFLDNSSERRRRQ